MSPSTDNERFKRLLISWPEKAIAYLRDAHYESLVRISVLNTHDRQASENIVHDALMDIWRDHERIAALKDLQIEAYLTTIVKNKSFAFYNRNIRQKPVEVGMTDEDFPDPDPLREVEIMDAEKKKVILNLIATFPKREKECLTLKFYQGMGNEAIAAQLNISIKSVERSITRAYKRFRKFGARLQ